MTPLAERRDVCATLPRAGTDSVDPRLLRLYSEELGHLREVGAEFAQAFPKIAGRLGMEGMEVADPYLERLLEGFAFLAARVQLRLDAEHPRLVAHLLESMYPGFLAPLPSMMVVRLDADASDPNLARGHTVPRGSAVVSRLPRGQETHCEFRTAHAVTLWPVTIASAAYASHLPDLPGSRLPELGAMRGALRLRLRCGGGTRFAGLGLDRLRVYIAAADDVAYPLHELLLGAALGSWVLTQGGAASGGADGWRGPDSVAACGEGEDEALLPVSLRGFSGHRLLQEVAALPQRLMFFELRDLADNTARRAHGRSRRCPQLPRVRITELLANPSACGGAASSHDGRCIVGGPDGCDLPDRWRRVASPGVLAIDLDSAASRSTSSHGFMQRRPGHRAPGAQPSRAAPAPNPLEGARRRARWFISVAVSAAGVMADPGHTP